MTYVKSTLIHHTLPRCKVCSRLKDLMLIILYRFAVQSGFAYRNVTFAECYGFKSLEMRKKIGNQVSYEHSSLPLTIIP